MKSYSQTEIFAKGETKLLILAAGVVKGLPDVDDRGNPIRCHEVARIVGAVLGLQVQDGIYGFVEHSWLWTTAFDPSKAVGRIGMPNILDPYCVGSLPQVRLLDGSTTSLPHVGWSYRTGQTRTDIDEAFVEKWVLQTACNLGF